MLQCYEVLNSEPAIFEKEVALKNAVNNNHHKICHDVACKFTMYVLNAATENLSMKVSCSCAMMTAATACVRACDIEPHR